MQPDRAKRSRREQMDDYYSSSSRKFWDFILGFLGAIIINGILWWSTVAQNPSWIIAYIPFYATEFVFSLVLAKSKRQYIFIGVLIVLAFMLVPLLLGGACIVILQTMSK
jgi:hypothetical protein